MSRPLLAVLVAGGSVVWILAGVGLLYLVGVLR